MREKVARRLASPRLSRVPEPLPQFFPQLYDQKLQQRPRQTELDGDMCQRLCGMGRGGIAPLSSRACRWRRRGRHRRKLLIHRAEELAHHHLRGPVE
jgi:hypothetical protein